MNRAERIRLEELKQQERATKASKLAPAQSKKETALMAWATGSRKRYQN